jgi:hypothetical protein
MQVDRYNELYDELMNFLDEKAGGIDEQALRIILASLWLHQFSKEPPVSLWLHGCPRWLRLALTATGAQEIPMRRAAFIAACARATKKPAVWILPDADAIFSGIRTGRRTMETLAGIARGQLDWAPWKVTADGLDPASSQPFIWNGRVTILACGPLALNPQQEIGWRAAWPAAEKSFTEVRIQALGEFSPRQAELSVAARGEAAKIGRLILNLLDPDFRLSNKMDAPRQPSNLFDSALWLTHVAGSFRGLGFDVAELGARAIRLAIAHASMMGKPELDAEDAGLARRIALDAIPRVQYQIAKAIPLDGYFTLEQLSERSKIKPRSCSEAVEILLKAKCLAKPEPVRGLKPVVAYRVTSEFQRALMAGL